MKTSVKLPGPGPWGVRVTEREWRTVNRLARERGTSVDALLREWGVERLLELARGPEAGPGPVADEG